jgi:organic radical activating enzyme
VTSAFISEIYTSLQGEGPFTGERQIFVRLAGCPLRCDYCDTPNSLVARGHPKHSALETARLIFNESRLHKATTVSITGGEPLVQATFLSELLPVLRQKKFRIYLETAGVHPRNLTRVVKDCDVIAMDIKLPSATGKSHWDAHAEFLAVAAGKAFAKIVVERRSTKKEFSRALKLLSTSSIKPLLVLQPVTPGNSGVEAPTLEQLGDFYAMATQKLPRVLVMPQQHKLWGIR